ncbi:MAG: PKD domain-containing protein [Burkholderiaceae bacterium]|nr:PKD domain-containing protein [Microbacteriaceae bacterium]
MGRAPRSLRRFAAIATVAILTGSLMVFAQPAFADTAPAPATPATESTVSSDALPTVQIDGVVWDQVVVGNTVYVGGNFANARPAGNAVGVGNVARTNLLAYNLQTGNLITGFNHTLNGEVRSVAASPDGTRLYAAGLFTAVDGTARYRVAAFNTATGALITTFAPAANTVVESIVATNTTVYLGGNFSAIGTTARTKVAAVRASNGTLLPFAPVIDSGRVRAIVVSPDESKIVIGGSFLTVNGSGNPGYGLAAVTASTGALLPWNANNIIRNAGADASVYSLTSDGDSVYGTGYHFGGGGTLEGTFRADWANGDIVWVADCHGDTYSVAQSSGVLYTASHAHYCANAGGFPQTDPWTIQRAMAWSKSLSGGVNGNVTYGYYSFAGVPTPKLLNWWPDINTGTFTGAGQGAWDVAANNSYVLYGGEFTTVNGKRQQGLVRFANSSIAPNTDGPRLSGAAFVPTAVSYASGTVRLAWLANYDRDNQYLTYDLIRDGVNATPVYTTVKGSRIWFDRPTMGYLDQGLTPGQTYTYRLRAKDPFGNVVYGDPVSVTASAAGPISPYASSVISDGAASYWRLGEASGPTVYDWAGFGDAVAGTGVTRGATGAIGGDSNTASTFSGDGTGLVASQTATQGPDTFAIEAWFKTTSTGGGKIVGFGNSNTGNSSSYDRHIFMDGSGRVYFGVYPGGIRTVQSSAGLNDGQWHQVVGNLSSAGMQLYIDGKRVAQRTDTTNGQAYSGYWRIGGDSTWNGNQYFQGSIDDVAIYNAPLTAGQVNNHLALSGRTSTIPASPTDTYGAAVFTDNPDLYWRLGETSGTTAADAMGDSTGIYSGDVTKGATGAVTGTTNAAASFGGTDGLVASSKQYSNPQEYSLELWFNSTTNRGGKLIGFGQNQSGTSSSYDRHVYLQDDGKIVFGTYTGQLNTITTAASYTDGAWHHVVATQSGAGLKLYVDGQLSGTNPTTSAQGYDGYWRVGGDTTWGSSSAYVNARIDEVAVYGTAITAATVAHHYDLGTGQPVNAAPVASFTGTPTDLTVAVDGTASTDIDGTVASYAWTFGDGATATGSTATHTYAAAGNYPVVLTVTDNAGATNTQTRTVTVTAANIAPTAAFTTGVSNLVLAVNGNTSSDPDGTIAGYAWDFGDGSTATGATASHTYASAGTRTVTLTVTDDRGATNVATQPVTVALANVAPTAAFTSTVANLATSVDGTTSSDSDGTVSSWAWNFGDGSTATGSTASHTYASAGTYAVTLTVTDNQGATNQSSAPVTVAAPPPANVAPTAVFSATSADLTATVDGSGSSDTDGTIAAWAWNFGDSATGTGSSTTHAYTAAGTYTVTLTVTDNAGAVGTTTRQVTVTAPVVPTTDLAADAFTRTTANGLGTATTGGAWTTSGTAANFSVDGQTARLRSTAAGVNLHGYLTAVSSTDTEVRVTTSLTAASSGGGTFVSVIGRRVGTSDYRARAVISSTGSVVAQVQRNGTTLQAATVSGLSYAVGDKLQVRVQVFGTSPTTVRAKVWKLGTTEPSAWQVSATDSTAGLQSAGHIGLGSYLSGTSSVLPLTVTFDDLWAGSTASTPVTPPANMAPVAAFSSTAANLAATVDGSGSTDSDGTVASYAWNFGDGATATGATASHTYAAAGTYTVTLTVTDNAGATGTTSKGIAVTAPGTPAVLAADTFERAVTGGWATADSGGAWTTSTAANLSVAGGAGLLRVGSAGALVEAYLASVSSTTADVLVSASPQQTVSGSGLYVSVIGRRVGTQDYRARLVIGATGAVNLQLQRSGVTLVATSAGVGYVAGDTLQVRVQVSGASPTTIRAKVWKSTDAEPTAWRLSTTDSTAALQSAGSIGLGSYLAGNATVVPLSTAFDNLSVTVPL